MGQTVLKAKDRKIHNARNHRFAPDWYPINREKFQLAVRDVLGRAYKEVVESQETADDWDVKVQAHVNQLQ